MSDHPQDRLTPSLATSSPALPSAPTPAAGLAEVAPSPPSAPDELRTEQQGQSRSHLGQGDGGSRGGDRGVENCCDALTGSLRVSGCASAAAESASVAVAGLQPLPPRKSGAARLSTRESSQQQQQQQRYLQEVTHQQHQPWQQSQRSSAPADAGAEVAAHTSGRHEGERGHEESERGLEASERRQEDDETALPAGLDGRRMPRHVAIILDGNSRWAKRRGLPREMGHEAGVQALKRIVRMSGHWGIEALTVFAFSTENWNRPKMEVDFIMALMERMMDDDIEELHSQGVAIHIMGQKARLAPSLQRKAAQAEQRTAGNTRLRLTVALSYSGRQDIVRACQALAAAAAAGRLQPEDIDEAAVDAALGTAWLGPGLESPDLLIRTSGEQRLSNFLLWQAAYSELVFSPCLWPDFGRAEFADCLAQFQRRDRRFGKRDGEAQDGQKPQQ